VYVKLQETQLKLSVKSPNVNSLPNFTGVWVVISWFFTPFRFQCDCELEIKLMV